MIEIEDMVFKPFKHIIINGYSGQTWMKEFTIVSFNIKQELLCL